MTLQVRELECRRGDTSLFADMAFELHPGELMHVKGSNGSGKTSLLRIVCGLFVPERGEVLWRGENIREARDDYNRELTYIGHLNGIKDELSAVENLKIYARFAGVELTEDRLRDALHRMGLRRREDLPSKVLSQGQKRRVALARLLLSGTTLWVMDEPFTALDVRAVDLLQSVISNHLKSGGMALLTTHQDVEITSDAHRHVNLDSWARPV
jgi:heme exporter protein A